MPAGRKRNSVFGERVKDRRRSSNVIDQRRDPKTTEKSERLHPMGAKFVKGQKRIEAVHRSKTVGEAKIRHTINEIESSWKKKNGS